MIKFPLLAWSGQSRHICAKNTAVLRRYPSISFFQKMDTVQFQLVYQSMYTMSTWLGNEVCLLPGVLTTVPCPTSSSFWILCA